MIFIIIIIIWLLSDQANIMRVKITQLDREQVNICVDKEKKSHQEEEEEDIHGFIGRKTVFAGQNKPSRAFHREFLQNCIKESLSVSHLCDVQLVLSNGSLDVSRSSITNHIQFD